jgi:hypothetical protein
VVETSCACDLGLKAQWSSRPKNSLGPHAEDSGRSSTLPPSEDSCETMLIVPFSRTIYRVMVS